jgi:hypothetical protein
VLAIPVRGVRIDLRLGQLAGERLDLALVRREREVHGRQDIDVRHVLLLAAVAAGLAGCRGARGPESVVEAWSDAVNDGDNERAARLFADEAQVVQGGRTIVFHDRSEARSWNAALPCSGRILTLDAKDDLAEATFVLADRGDTACDAPGATARVLVRVREGKIVLWHQLASDEPSQVV